MKSSAFIIFFSIVLTVYISVNYLIYSRGLQCISDNGHFKLTYRLIFIFLFSSFILSRFIEYWAVNSFTNFIHWVGALWLGAMLYISLFLFFIDIIRLFNHWFDFYPAFITNDMNKTRLIIGISVLSSVILILISGYINAINPKIANIDLTKEIKKPTRQGIRIAFASDIHLGILVGKSRIEWLVDKINEQKPDIIIFGGDIVSEDFASVMKYDIAEPLKKLYAPLGVYAITGNHEFIGGIQRSSEYIISKNIKLLRDTTILIDNQFYLVGRDDKFGGKRQPLTKLIENIDKKLPIVVIDHQPLKLNESAELNVDLQISGHTHHGQLFPINYITKAVYEISWGLYKKNNTNYYVSSGYGSWGPPIRLGSRPEIVIIKI